MVKFKKGIEKEAQNRLFSKPSNRVRIVVMVDREHEATLYRLGNGKITRGMDVLFETLRLYNEKERAS